jgi:hypothetical protein
MALDVPMTVKRVVLAFLIGLLAMLVSFLMTFVIALAWYAHAYPHDGQDGLGAFVMGLYVAPPCGVAALLSYFVYSRNQHAG